MFTWEKIEKTAQVVLIIIFTVSTIVYIYIYLTETADNERFCIKLGYDEVSDDDRSNGIKYLKCVKIIDRPGQDEKIYSDWLEVR